MSMKIFTKALVLPCNGKIVPCYTMNKTNNCS